MHRLTANQGIYLQKDNAWNESIEKKTNQMWATDEPFPDVTAVVRD